MQSNNTPKFSFIGLSIGIDTSNESAVVVIDSDLNLIKVDKAYQLPELKTIITNFSELAPTKNTVLCVDLPRNATMLTGKWRIESKQTQILTLNDKESIDKKSSWKLRYSDRGSDICNHFSSIGMDVYRYNSYFTINMLKLNPPYKTRIPAGCKFLQLIIEEKLKIKGIPTNLLPLPAMHALIGAYNSWKLSTSKENSGFKKIGVYKNLPIITAITT